MSLGGCVVIKIAVVVSIRPAYKIISLLGRGGKGKSHCWTHSNVRISYATDNPFLLFFLFSFFVFRDPVILEVRSEDRNEAKQAP